MTALRGKVAVVAGATRGAGRGIACMLGESETPCFVGRAVASLAADPAVQRKAGRVWASWTLAREYGFTDIDGRQPDWGAHFDRVSAGILERGGPTDAQEAFLLTARYHQVHLDPGRADEAARIEAALAGAGDPVDGGAE